MNWFNTMFGTGQQQTAQQQQPAATNNPAKNDEANLKTQKTAGTDANGVVPEQKEDKNESPLAKFEKLWQPVETDPNAQPTSSELTQEKIMEAAGKVDFSKVLNREDLQKISAGGEEAVNVLMAALNKVGQQSYGQSLVIANKLVQREVAKAREEFSSQLPSLVRKESTRDSLLAENPALSNPAVAPVIEALQGQFAQKYPNATPSELKTLALEYMTQVGQIFNPPKSSDKAKTKTGQANEEGWDEWLKLG